MCVCVHALCVCVCVHAVCVCVCVQVYVCVYVCVCVGSTCVLIHMRIYVESNRTPIVGNSNEKNNFNISKSGFAKC